MWGHVHQLPQPASEKPVSRSFLSGRILSDTLQKSDSLKKKRLPVNWDLQQLSAKGIKWRAFKVLQELCRHFPCHISNWIDKLREKFSKWISGIIRPEAAPWLHGNTPPPKLCHVCPHFGGQGTPNRIGGFKKIGLLTAQRQPIQLIQKHSSLRLSNRTLKGKPSSGVSICSETLIFSCPSFWPKI